MVLQNAFENLATESTLESLRVLSDDSLYTELFSDDTLIATEADVESEWLDFQTLKVDALRITHTRTNGTYVIEVDWSRDGITTDITEVLTVVNNTSGSKRVAMRYGRFRIRNTSPDTAFSTHLTVIIGRPR